MKKLLTLAIVVLTIAGCTPTEKGAAIGAGTGAAVGAVATGSVAGAGWGALIGGAAGAVIGHVAGESNQCWYKDKYGRKYKDRCPSGY
jgi:hypothetical protein